MSNWGLAGGAVGGESVGFDTGGTDGTGITSSATAHTKGSWVQFIASTAKDAYGIYMSIRNAIHAAENTHSLIDIGIGAAASEEVVVPDIYYAGESVDSGNGILGFGQVFFPMRIPKGSRIAMRFQDSAASAENMKVNLGICHGGFLMPAPLGAIDALGAGSGTSKGTDMPNPASNNALGAWAQMVASSARAYKRLWICVGQDNDNTMQTSVEVGVGAASSEVVVVPEMACFAHGSRGNSTSPGMVGPYPVSIPEGSRIACRARSSTATRSSVVSLLAQG